MKREFLEGLGLEKDTIDKIMAEHGKTVEANKQKVSTLEAERDDAKTKLTEANKKIEEFKDLDIESIKQKAEDYKTKFEQSEKDSQEKLEKLQFEHALERALLENKPKNAKAVKALLDMEGLKFNDGKIVGLDEQLKKIKEDNDYLFEAQEGGDKGPGLSGMEPGKGGASGGGSKEYTAEQLDKMSDEEYFKAKYPAKEK